MVSCGNQEDAAGLVPSAMFERCCRPCRRDKTSRPPPRQRSAARTSPFADLDVEAIAAGNSARGG